VGAGVVVGAALVVTFGVVVGAEVGAEVGAVVGAFGVVVGAEVGAEVGAAVVVAFGVVVGAVVGAAVVVTFGVVVTTAQDAECRFWLLKGERGQKGDGAAACGSLSTQCSGQQGMRSAPGLVVGAAVVVARGDVVGAAVVVARGVVVITVAGRGAGPVRTDGHEGIQVATCSQCPARATNASAGNQR